MHVDDAGGRLRKQSVGRRRLTRALSVRLAAAGRIPVDRRRVARVRVW